MPNAGFIETMDCLPVPKLPEGPKWTYEIKLDGYRLEVVRSAGRTTLYSRRQNVLNQKFPYIAAALKDLPDDTVIVYREKDLIYAARVRAGLVPATRREVFERIKSLKTPRCPFANLPELTAGRWGQGLTTEKMKECAWVRPEMVARIQFLEWTVADHLRHTKFIALRDDRDPSKVVRET